MCQKSVKFDIIGKDIGFKCHGLMQKAVSSNDVTIVYVIYNITYIVYVQ